MSFPVESLIKNKVEFSAKDVPIKWSLKLISENVVNTIKKEGLFNINLEYNPKIINILNAKTEITSYIQPFSQMNFTDSENKIKFRLNLGRVINFSIMEDEIEVQFKFHEANPQFGFEINTPIASGVVNISGDEATISKLERIFRKNLFVDDEYLIPSCEKCKGLKCISGTTESIEGLTDSDFICGECYTTANNYCNLLINEFEKPLNVDNLNQQSSMLLDLIAKGKQNAKTIMESQLSHFYDVFYIFIEYVMGVFPKQETIKRLNKLNEFCKKRDYKKLKDYVEIVLKKIETYGSQDQISTTKSEKTQKIEDQNNFSNELIDEGTFDLENELKSVNDLSLKITENHESNLDISHLLKQTLQGFEEILNKISVLEPDLKQACVSPLDRLRSINSSILKEPGKKDTKENLPNFSDNNLDKFDSLDLKPITEKEIIQINPKKIDIRDEIPDNTMEKIMKWIQILDENSELEEIPEEIVEILKNNKVEKLVEQCTSSNDEYEKEIKSKITSLNENINTPEAVNPSVSNPPGTVKLPPGFNPPRKINLPTGFNPPKPVSSSQDFNSSKSKSFIPGFNPPKKSSEPKN